MAKKKGVLKLKMAVRETPKTLRQGKVERPTRKHAHALFCVMTKFVKKKNQFVFSDNISMGGVFLETSDPLPPGTKVALRFPLKSALRPIEISGRVVRSHRRIEEGRLGTKTPGMAIAFESVKRVDAKFLKEFLDHTLSYGWFLE